MCIAFTLRAHQGMYWSVKVHKYAFHFLTLFFVCLFFSGRAVALTRYSFSGTSNKQKAEGER